MFDIARLIEQCGMDIRLHNGILRTIMVGDSHVERSQELTSPREQFTGLLGILEDVFSSLLYCLVLVAG